MAGAEKVAEKIPGWVEGLLIPTLESRVRGVVREEVGHLEKTLDARFDAINVRFDGINDKFDAVNGKFDAVNARIDSLERRIPIVQDIADLKARLAAVEKRTSV